MIINMNGQMFDPLTQVQSIGCIAHALSNVCRFGGHCPRFYSVAQHSVLVSRLCSKESRCWGLMHDAAESQVGDMVTSIKKQRFMAGYREAEDELLLEISKKFLLPWPIPEEVWIADRALLRAEIEQLFPMNAQIEEFCEKLPKVDIKITPWSPEDSRDTFMIEFRSLFDDYNC